MALSGLHVTCAEAGNPYSDGQGGTDRPELIFNGWWSETMASAGTTTQAAPLNVAAIFRVEASADSWIALGPSPNASQAVGTGRNTTRYLVRAGISYDFNVNTSDKLAWIAA